MEIDFCTFSIFCFALRNENFMLSQGTCINSLELNSPGSMPSALGIINVSRNEIMSRERQRSGILNRRAHTFKSRIRRVCYLLLVFIYVFFFFFAGLA